jgi:8-oxo-dGTP diphosphatase
VKALKNGISTNIYKSAMRETKEETGLEIKNLKFIFATNDIFSKEKHYVTIFIKCDQKDNNKSPLLLEEDKCEGLKY